MADEDKSALMSRLEGARLPAKKQPSAPAGKEPADRSRRSVPSEPTGRRARSPQTPTREPQRASQPTRRTSAAPVTEFYTVGGEEYTFEELKEKGLLPKLITTYEQAGHLQKIHLDDLKKIDELEKGKTAPPPRAPTAEEVWAVVKREYATVVQQAIKRDIDADELEGDLQELYPNTVNTLYTRILYEADRVARLEEAVVQLAQATQGVTAKEKRAELERQMGKHLDALVDEDDVYGPLDDPDARAGFFDFLFEEINPTKEQVIGEKAKTYLARQWIAYNAEAIKAGQEPGRGRINDNPRIHGEDAGTRLGGFRSEEEDPMQQHIGDLASSVLPQA